MATSETALCGVCDERPTGLAFPQSHSRSFALDSGSIRGSLPPTLRTHNPRHERLRQSAFYLSR